MDNKKDSKRRKNVLNPNNIFITKKNIRNILKKGNIKLDIKDMTIWQQSFVHKSYVNKLKNISNDKKIVPFQKKSNERLEWLGDANIQGVVSDYLWRRFPDENEGFLTKLRSKLVKTKNLSFLAKKLGLQKYILISHHVDFGCNGRENLKILENTFEAFIAAIYIESSKKVNCGYAYEIVKKFFVTLIEKYVDITELIINEENLKDQLMWYFQKKFNGSYPVYIKEKYENDFFYIYIREPNTNKIIGKGHAKSKQKAEQNAAKNALLYYSSIDMI